MPRSACIDQASGAKHCAPPSGYGSSVTVKPLHFALSDHGSVLVTRNAGRQVAAHLGELFHGDTSLVLDFAGVEAVTPPFLDELLRLLRAEMAAEREGRVVVLTNLVEDVRETIELVLARHKLSLAELREARVHLLTSVPYLAETLEAAQALGTPYFTAPQLATRLALKLPNANQRLGQLVQAGAIARERDPDAERGKRYRYRAAPQALLPS
jgi:DNA-binding MarR family transcriptional regulator